MSEAAAPAPAQPAATAGESSAQCGLGAAIALIMGSIIGVGIFNLPTSLAAYGPITLVSNGPDVGALVLALLFSALSKRLPADGGPYAYARVGFGNALGFTNAWSYWITAWAGNAAIAVGWVLYVATREDDPARPGTALQGMTTAAGARPCLCTRAEAAG